LQVDSFTGSSHTIHLEASVIHWILLLSTTPSSIFKRGIERTDHLSARYYICIESDLYRRHFTAILLIYQHDQWESYANVMKEASCNPIAREPMPNGERDHNDKNRENGSR
jgi:hypothetical protein